MSQLAACPCLWGIPLRCLCEDVFDSLCPPTLPLQLNELLADAGVEAVCLDILKLTFGPYSGEAGESWEPCAAKVSPFNSLTGLPLLMRPGCTTLVALLQQSCCKSCCGVHEEAWRTCLSTCMNLCASASKCPLPLHRAGITASTTSFSLVLNLTTAAEADTIGE